MTTPPLQSVLCHYRYDALDRSITWTPDRQAGHQRFFCKDRLATEIQNAAQHSIFQHDDQVLAQQNRWGDKVDTTLLATDHQRSVLNAVDSIQAHRIAYTPFGHRPLESGLLSLLGFNGEQPDLVTGHYHLGNGYRQFNPVLMRFNSADKLSPFGKGGVNAYAYCGNDPLNWTDPNGTSKIFRLIFGRGKNISTDDAYNMASTFINENISASAKTRMLYTASDSTKTIDIGKYNKHSQKKIWRELQKREETLVETVKKSKLSLTETYLKSVAASDNLGGITERLIFHPHTTTVQKFNFFDNARLTTKTRENAIGYAIENTKSINSLNNDIKTHTIDLLYERLRILREKI